ncbi:MAG: cytochrome P450 [Actinomycetota bacterium]
MPDSPLVDELDPVVQNYGDLRDPYSGYARGRRDGVLHEDHLGIQVYRVYRHADVERVLRDGERFSARINGALMRPFLGETILEMDGPRHQQARGLIAHPFRPTVVKTWEENLIRPTAHEVIDRFAARGSAELVREFAWQFPVRVFAKLLGIPLTDYESWGRWAIDLERLSVDWDRGVAATKAVHDYFAPIIEQRRAEPNGDFVSELVTAELQGERLTEGLIHGFIRLLIPAGQSTTYRLVGTLMLAMLSHPEQLEAVRADRSLVHGAVEEALRWESPVQFAAREANEDTELAGIPIPKGAGVTSVLGSANRDPDRWDDPDRFDITRKHQGHVAFGEGAHMCLGAHLARLEAHVALNVVLDRLPDIRLDPAGDDPHWVGWAFRSPTSVPVLFSPS